LHNKPTYTGEDTKSMGAGSSASNASNLSRVQENIQNVGKHDPYRIKLLQDKLDDRGKARLAKLLEEIDENIDGLMEEKKEYYKHGAKSTAGGFVDGKSHVSRVTGVSKADSNNAYLYTGTDQDRMQGINVELSRYNSAMSSMPSAGEDRFDT